MKLVILESPYAGEVERNFNYAKLCLRDCLLRHGEYPFASHLLYTLDGVLDDRYSLSRFIGINAGLAWKKVADKTVFYVDLGWSAGMDQALKFCEAEGLKFESRKLPPSELALL